MVQFESSFFQKYFLQLLQSYLLIKNATFYGVFDAFLFQHLIKGNWLCNSRFVTCYCLKMAPKVGKNSKFTKDQGIFADWTVDGAQYAFHENCLY